MRLFRLLRMPRRHDPEKSPAGPLPAAHSNPRPRRLALLLLVVLLATATVTILHLIAIPTPSTIAGTTSTPINYPQLDVGSQKFWLSGSWGDVVQAPQGCWPHPRFESFAIACPRERRETTPLVVTMELMPLLEVHQVRCKSCTTNPSSPEMDIRTKFILNRTKDEKKGSRSAQILEVRLPPFSICCQSQDNYRKDEWGFDSNGLNYSTCMVRFDMLVSFKGKRGLSPKSIPPICFAAIGDWGAPKPEQNMIIRQLKLLMRQHWVKFMVSTGDNFYPVGVRSLLDEQWVNTFERPFSHKEFQRVPFLISAGNHDLAGKLSVLIEYSKLNPMWFFPASYFGLTIPLVKSCTKTNDWKNNKGEDSEGSPSCTADVMDIFVMNSYEEKTWKKQVKSGDAFFDARPFDDIRQHRWRLVLNHEALLSGSMHGFKMSRNKVFRDRILPFLSKHKIHAYLNGDDHLLEIHHLNGTDFITSGSGGGSVRYQSFERLPTTVWRPEIKQGMYGEGKRYILGPTLHCTVPFSNSLTTRLYNVSDTHEEEVYVHDTKYDRK
ncbi:Calcineurin-like phosphoesterase domain [Trypanosoma melophagium]|uniref:Calcineurin-like phosphoesterase domain n=1 Tax=Trypanosoma melophagium TaxID=715481 RepID=UPI00351A273F|nr:Calcineurin-like phosphoesterase domain [Trypanosoma melophagium]